MGTADRKRYRHSERSEPLCDHAGRCVHLLIGCWSQLQTEFSDPKSKEKEKEVEENNNNNSHWRLLLHKQRELIVRHWGSFWKSMGDAANTGNTLLLLLLLYGETARVHLWAMRLLNSQCH